jgi:hypothetical protein
MYRGFIIDENVSQKFLTTYFSVINPRKVVGNSNVHIHTDRENVAKKIVDCYYATNKNRFGRAIRNKAMSLDGIKVLY